MMRNDADRGDPVPAVDKARSADFPVDPSAVSSDTARTCATPVPPASDAPAPHEQFGEAEARPSVEDCFDGICAHDGDCPAMPVASPAQEATPPRAFSEQFTASAEFRKRESAKDNPPRARYPCGCVILAAPTPEATGAPEPDEVWQDRIWLAVWEGRQWTSAECVALRLWLRDLVALRATVTALTAERGERAQNNAGGKTEKAAPAVPNQPQEPQTRGKVR